MLRKFTSRVLARENTTPAAFFKRASYSFQSKAYPLGSTPHSAPTKEKQQEIAQTKQTLKKYLSCTPEKQPDLAAFIDLLFDYERATGLLRQIDVETQKRVRRIDPDLFPAFQKVLLKGGEESVQGFLKERFLPGLRSIFQALACHYGFDPYLVESNDGLLLEEDYIDFVHQGKLVLDLGEDGHGPLPHVIAAFMMKEFELAGGIKKAHSFYRSLAERCDYYCPERKNFATRFFLLLDNPNPDLLASLEFCNPASLSNYLLSHGKTLKQITAVCKNHSRALAEISRKEWETRAKKPHFTNGKVLI